MKDFEDLMWLYNTDDTRGISRINIDEAAALWWCVERSPGPVIEVGSLYGGTTVLIASAMERYRTLYTIDKEHKHHKFTKGVIEEMDNIEVITGDSSKVELEIDKEAGVIFFDGDHTYEGVKGDVENLWKYLRLRGLAIFHDAAPNPDPGFCGGVARVVSELVDSGKAYKLETVRSTVVLEKRK